MDNFSLDHNSLVPVNCISSLLTLPLEIMD